MRRFVTLALLLMACAHGTRAPAVPSVPYPEAARRNRISGAVRLEVSIDSAGAVTAVKIISGPG